MKSLITLIVGATIFLASCKSSVNKNHLLSLHEVTVDSLPGECPYFTKDNKGNTVLSWVRTAGDSVAFCYAVSSSGKSFAKPVVIPNSNNIQPHGENLPKIIFKPSGEIIALWGAANPNAKNKYSGLVFYVQSFDDGKTWTGPKSLVKDTGSIDQRYYDVALLPNGEAAIIWLDNRKSTPKEGSSLYFATTNGKNGFQNDRRIAESCCQCCRTDLFVDAKGGIHVLYRGIIDGGIRDMVHAVSVDGGKNFSTPQRISNDNWVINGCPHTGPSMTENKQGLHFAWFTGGKNKGSFYTKSADDGKSFIMHDSVSSLGSHPQLASLPDGQLLIAWDENEVSGNKVYKKIGVQRRTAEGAGIGKEYITSDTSNASFPVLAPLPQHASLVAYTEMRGKKNYISCQLLSLPD